MDTSRFEEWLAQKNQTFRKIAPLILVVSSLLTIGLIAHLVTNPPSFQTDLNDFAPHSEEDDLHDTISEIFPNESRPMFVHVTHDTEENVLTIESIQAMLDDLAQFENESAKRQNVVVEWTTTPGILQTALDEEANGTELSTIASWEELFDLVLDEDQRCTLNANDKFLSMSTYISSALLNLSLIHI